MASRLGQRLFAQAARSSRVGGRVASRRSMASTAEHASASGSNPYPIGSDRPWLVGSLLVFAPAAFYLLSPSAKSSHGASHGASHDAHAKHDDKLPTEDDEGTEAPAEEVDASAKKAFDADAPKDAQAAEEGSEQQSMTDSEGETVSGEEIKESIQQAANEDLPPDAQAHEEQDAKYSSGAPGVSAAAESQPDQKEKPGKAHPGTLQSNEDSGPTNINDARKVAKSGQAPKEAKGKEGSQ
ncbi:hypothetical protein WOLCODRAFT_136555 [Wolfiporia cocos MD-104 SS10]|uniref:Uncharacterized protein n=1 Tax=Wolfiporia cocos (strain MD-104) TaxID=742152 RepID=A0A2H3JCD8_WOLCO|nr:hypothetical protein WOLCODRAFT_136555 [Wolfiporia cocos MD-104 SS10]